MIPIKNLDLYFSSLLLITSLFIFISCSSEGDKRFTLLSPDRTNIQFVNQVKSTPKFNIFNYYNFYNGGGVAAGDINNDGLADLFFVGNETTNRLYLNKGNFRFEDVTDSAGVGGTSGSWSTGVTMADVNGDNYLDIYVSHVNYRNKSGPNQLFINNRDGTFSERAEEYGLDFRRYSTQAAFFDYNNDGRLDIYFLNQSFPSKKIFGEADVLRNRNDPNAGDRLYRNDGTTFTDVTDEAGIYSSALGLGLGVAVSDINKDGWMDIYVGNDAHEDDYLYINNGDGTFIEALSASMGHTSRSSMGNDIADFNNDGNVDIISVDMMARDRKTYMSSGGPALYLVYEKYLDLGYGHNNERNTLQLNRGEDPDGTPLFSDIAFVADVARSTWSWASLFMDMDNDGLKDLYVTNGMPRRTNDLDATRRSEIRAARSTTEINFNTKESLTRTLREMPREKVPNYIFQNNGDLTFSDKTDLWGLHQPSISSGAAYADLDRDGDLDIVVNNTNMSSFVYKNNTMEKDSTKTYLAVHLNGSGHNSSGIGAKIILYHQNQTFYQEQIPTRGFQSSVDHALHFGTGNITKLDSVLIVWPDQSSQTLTGIETDQVLELNQDEASGSFNYQRLHKSWEETELQDVTEEIGLEYVHKENPFNDYKREPLIPYKLSTQGPALSVGDVNSDGLDDFFVGGAKGQAGKLFIQKSNGDFISSNEQLLTADKGSEDVDAAIFDATGDGIQDLYVVSGGGELNGYNDVLKDRLYVNGGNGEFVKSTEHLPEMFTNGSVVAPSDYDNDGDIDLFVGGRSIPYRYGISPKSYLLENDGNGKFTDVTKAKAPELQNVGMVTDAKWANITNKEYPELVISGEWMPVQLFSNDGMILTNKTEEFGLADKSGLWQTIAIRDLNLDGRQDIIAGNFGTNSRIQPTADAPYRLYINDFTDDGQSTPIIAEYMNGDYYPYEQLHELLMRIKFLVRRVNSYEDYSTKTMEELFGSNAIESARTKEITEIRSLIFMADTSGVFTSKPLPVEAQITPIMAIHTISQDNNVLLLGGIFTM